VRRSAGKRSVSRVMRHASCVTNHASHVARHTSPVSHGVDGGVKGSGHPRQRPLPSTCVYMSHSSVRSHMSNKSVTRHTHKSHVTPFDDASDSMKNLRADVLAPTLCASMQ